MSERLRQRREREACGDGRRVRDGGVRVWEWACGGCVVIPVMVLVQHPESRHGKESPRRPWSTYGTGFLECFFFSCSFRFLCQDDNAPTGSSLSEGPPFSHLTDFFLLYIPQSQGNKNNIERSSHRGPLPMSRLQHNRSTV